MNFPQRRDQRIFPLSILAVSLCLIVFEVVRAARATFYFDEANTFLNYLSSNILAIFNFNSANNHFLNSLLAKLFSVLAGTSELVLRLPNLVGFAVYLLFSFLIIDTFVKNKLAAFCGFLWLSTNLYLLEFFSLCRGYGLSLGLLMAALFFFFRFLKRLPDNTAEPGPDLPYSLTALGLGVLSNFSLLAVYVSLVAFASGIFVVSNLKKTPADSSLPSVQKPPKNQKALLVGLGLAAVIFNFLLVPQDFRLAEKFFEVVTVRIEGLDEKDKNDIEVFRMNIQNEEEKLAPRDDIWRLDKPDYFTSVKFRCPPALIDKIKRIQIIIGSKTFSIAEADLAKVKTDASKKYSVFSTPYNLSLKRSVIPAFQPIINWNGDQALVSRALIRLLMVLAIWVLAFLALIVLGKLLARLRIMTPRQFQPLAVSTFVLGMFVGYPLYLLKAGGALWYGGRAGWLPDTVFSLINNSFYGELYFRRQEWAVLFVVCLLFLAFLIRLFIAYRKRALAELRPGLAVVFLLVLASGCVILQKIILDNPYPIGRTALFFIPLFLLMLIFLFQSFSGLTAGRRMAVLSLVVVLTLLAVAHFLGHASTTMIIESRIESDTKSMLKDLQRIRSLDVVHNPKISLGLDSAFLPSLQYYQRRNAWAWLEVHSAPPFKGNDFDYLRHSGDGDRLAGLGLILIKRYPVSGTILLKSGQD